ncbi:MAG: phytoene/squalene synthase family protein [Halorientalis sp.]
MVHTDPLRESKEIHRQTGRTFYYATWLLPERVRHRTYVLYAFFRVADEVVDDPDSDLTAAEQRRELDRIEAAALGRRETDDPVLAAFDRVRREAGIRTADVTAFLDSMRADVEQSRYDTREELAAYVDGSAAAVGCMMTTIMDVDDPALARPHARALGAAFQLTNFLRDVGEDVRERDRIYLPWETLSSHGVTPEQIAAGEADGPFRAVVREELSRAEERYREGVAGIKYLPEDCQFAVMLAAVLYADHHRAIRERDHDVLSATPGLSTTRKLLLVARTRWHWHWNRDPEAVFERVSAIGDAPASATGPEPPTSVPTQ